MSANNKKKPKPDLDKVAKELSPYLEKYLNLDLTTDNLDFIINTIHTRLKNDIGSNIDKSLKSLKDEFRAEIENLRKDMVGSENGEKSIDLGLEKIMKDPKIQELASKLESSENTPSPQQGGFMQLIQFIQNMEKLDTGGSAGFAGQSMNDILYRSWIASENMKNQMFFAQVKQSLKNAGVTDQEIKELEKTNEELMGGLHHLGSRSKQNVQARQ